MKLLIKIINTVIMVVMWVVLWRLIGTTLNMADKHFKINPFLLDITVFVSALFLVFLVNGEFQFRYTFY